MGDFLLQLYMLIYFEEYTEARSHILTAPNCAAHRLLLVSAFGWVGPKRK